MINNNIICGPWTGRMTLDDFYHRANQHLATIIAGQKALTSLLKLLRAGESINIDQWRYALNAIPRLSRSVHNFCQLLENPNELPAAVIPLRYLLATALYDVDEQIMGVMPIIIRANAGIRKRPKRFFDQELQDRLRQLIKGCKDIREAHHKLVEKLFPKTPMAGQFRIVKYSSCL